MARHTITIRDLRNHFAKVKQLVETQGEVLVTDKGEPKYRLVLYTPVQKVSAPSKDYIARITRHQPRALSANEAKGLHEDNRGDR
jgi:prevent-host-death family protein